MCNWFTLLYISNEHNIINQLYSNKIKKKIYPIKKKAEQYQWNEHKPEFFHIFLAVELL